MPQIPAHGHAGSMWKDVLSVGAWRPPRPAGLWLRGTREAGSAVQRPRPKIQCTEEDGGRSARVWRPASVWACGQQTDQHEGGLGGGHRGEAIEGLACMQALEWRKGKEGGGHVGGAARGLGAMRYRYRRDRRASSTDQKSLATVEPIRTRRGPTDPKASTSRCNQSRTGQARSVYLGHD